MTTRLTEAPLHALHARYTRKGQRYAPPWDMTLEAAREGRLWLVDTQNAGEDCLSIGAMEDDVLSFVAAHHDVTAWANYPTGGIDYARSLRWSAERIVLAGT